MNHRKVLDIKASILAIEKIGQELYKAKLYAPEIAETAKPMQFVNVLVRDEGSSPLLRRPFGLSSVDTVSGVIEISWAVVGIGTRIMSNWAVGQTVSLLGPLGNGMALGAIESKNTVYLIAGGTGLAPLFPLIPFVNQKGKHAFVFYGARTRELLMDTQRLKTEGCKIFLATEDGTKGSKGYITDVLKDFVLASEPRRGTDDALAIACGPTPMLRKVKELFAQTDIPLYISLEERMACGYGVCRGCAVKASDPTQGYFHVCKDGPVFLADDIVLEGEA